MQPRTNLARLRRAELKDLVVQQWAEIAELRQMVAALREEVARLKGGPGRPNIKPSALEQASDPKPPDGRQRETRGCTRSKVTIHEERIVPVGGVPEGSRFKGYTSFLVQDLVIRTHVVDFRRERWQTAQGETITAPLPSGVRGHFGPELRRFVLAQYHQGQMTVPRLTLLLRTLGIVISKRQVVRLLIADQDEFVDEARDALRAGLASAPWITVDDTGARHKAQNGFCTQIGNQHFTWFGTTDSKSRRNFLALLRAGHDDYIINAEALTYMRERGLTAATIAQLAEHPERYFADTTAWNAHLAALGIVPLDVRADPALIATEGALWGSVKAHGFLRDTVIVSDDAGQFNVGPHALCWVHAERLVHKLDTFTDENRAAQSQTRERIRAYYRDLRAYRDAPTPQRKAELEAAFDGIFKAKTGFVTLDRLLARLFANKPELLMVLEHPQIPLHTNGSENDIRSHVTRRKISGGTRSDIGRDCRDAFLGLAKTCAKLHIAFWDYLGARLAVPDAPPIPLLPQLIAARARPP